MEAFVSDLLENADLRVITKKDVRVKYKNFLGRDISHEEKAKINDLVYAFVYYYAAKQKQQAESQQKSELPPQKGGKENKQAHGKDKGSKEDKYANLNRSHVLKGQVTDKINVKKKNLGKDVEYKEMDKKSSVPANRKTYPIRKRNESTRVQLADAISAVMASSSESSDSESSENSDLEMEVDEQEKQRICEAVKRLQREREIKIQLSLSRKRASLANKDKNRLVPDPCERSTQVKKKSAIKRLPIVAIKNSPLNVSSDDSVIILSDLYSPKSDFYSLEKTSPKVKASNVVIKAIPDKTSPMVKVSNVVIKANLDKTSPMVKASNAVIKANPDKTSPMVKASNVVIKANPDKTSPMVKALNVVIKANPDKTSPMVKTSNVVITAKNQKPVLSLTSGLSSSDSGELRVMKTPTSYSKVKKKLPGKMKKDSITAKVNLLKRNNQLKTDSESDQNGEPRKKKSKILVGDAVKKKLVEQMEMKKLVKRKRDVGALKKLKKQGKVIVSKMSKEIVSKQEKEIVSKQGKEIVSKQDKEIVSKQDKEIVNKKSKTIVSEQGKEIVSKSDINENTEQKTDNSNGELASPTCDKQNTHSNPDDLSSTTTDTDKTCESDSSYCPLSSELSVNLADTDSISSQEEGIKGLNNGFSCTDTDSPIKTTPSQLAKKKRKLMELASQEESLKNVSTSTETDDEFSTLLRRSKANKNGVTIVSDDSTDEDEPLSHVKAKIKKGKGLTPVKLQEKEVSPIESPQVVHLKNICRASGIFIRNDRQLKNCNTDKDKISALKNVLMEAGMKGPPSMKKAEDLLLKKEVLELSAKNIISSTETGRAFRNVKSIYARPKVTQSLKDEIAENSLKASSNCLEGVINLSSESSE